MTTGRQPEGQPRGAEPASGFRSGRIITPGSPRQLGKLGLFRPSDAQSRTLTPTTRPITARNAEPDLLWISFAELCGGLSSKADYLALAAAHRMWVIDGVPSPRLESALALELGPGSASAWQRFSNVVEVLHDQDIALFLIGTGPFDWDAAGTGAAVPVDMARMARRLSLLGRVESPDAGELAGTPGLGEGAGS